MSEQLAAGLNIDVDDADAKNACLAFGRVSSKGFEIYQLRQQPFRGLVQELTAAKFSAVGLNFPFSVPVDFIEFCAQKARHADFQSWQEYVEHLLFLDRSQFLELAYEFKREPLRNTDKQRLVAAVSPLHRKDPPMIDLTYLGMRNLAGLDPARFCIPPFHAAHAQLCSVLEVSPQDTLMVLNLMHKMPHGVMTASKARSSTHSPRDLAELQTLRRKVIENLLELKTTSPVSFKEHPDIFISSDVQAACIESEHALNALVACYTAALWIKAPSLFKDPFEENDEKVLLEGWAYVPR